MENTQQVVIKTSKSNAYACIVRACLTAANACRKMNDEAQLRQFLKLKTWADEQWMATL